jgi:YbgC/YbaW family acyl-CoA thioester hydrolase
MIGSESPHLETEVQVMFFDTDCAAVVHNIAYLRFIETNRTLLAEQLGMGLVAMAKTHTYPVVVRTEIDYRRPAALGDRLVVRGWLDRTERSRFWMGFEIHRPADSTLLVTCRQMLAVVEEGKPVRLTPEWARKWPHLRREEPGGKNQEPDKDRGAGT